MLEWPVHTWKYVQHPNLSIIKATVRYQCVSLKWLKVKTDNTTKGQTVHQRGYTNGKQKPAKMFIPWAITELQVKIKWDIITQLLEYLK